MDEIKKRTSDVLDSVSSHMVQSWLLMGVIVASWNDVLEIPEKIGLMVFGAGFDRLLESLSKARDGK
jgi:hypothetical protein